MSSRVRLYGYICGDWLTGRDVVNGLSSLAKHYLISLPVSMRTAPQWKKMKWLYEHLPSNGDIRELLIVREPRRIAVGYSKYKKICARIGKRRVTAPQPTPQAGPTLTFQFRNRTGRPVSTPPTSRQPQTPFVVPASDWGTWPEVFGGANAPYPRH